MAFGYEYLMVYLPAFNPDSFLLFVHNPAGATKLRDYSGGRCRVLGQPPLQDIVRATAGGRTRFTYAPHATTDEYYWSVETRDLNARYLTSPGSVSSAVTFDQPNTSVAKPLRDLASGRAPRGSQRELQDYINEHERVIHCAVLEALPVRYRELGASITWISPLVQDNYVEYRDDDFLRSVGLGEFASELAGFWPTGGPCWDALGIVSDFNKRFKPNIVLVEAKSHLSEIYGSGCQAGVRSRKLIEKSLANAKEWCGAKIDADWTGPLYQSANRLAHLYFIRERLKNFAWLVNLCFTGDPIGPADQLAWEAELKAVKSSLGINSALPFVINVFLPALESIESLDAVETCDRSVEADFGSSVSARETDTSLDPEHCERAGLTVIPTSADSFPAWADGWMALAKYPGYSAAEASNRIDHLVRLWRKPVPGAWMRGIDPQLLEARYRRGDLQTPHPGEHTIEHEILHGSFERLTCCGYKLVDGVNAFPLCRDASGFGRRGNVEADLLLLGL